MLVCEKAFLKSYRTKFEVTSWTMKSEKPESKTPIWDTYKLIITDFKHVQVLAQLSMHQKISE